jgi:uncharacterized protein (UPF0262 family)
MSGAFRLRRVDIDPASIAATTREAEHERQVAIFDLIEQNEFRPAGAEAGPFELTLSVEEQRLIMEVTGPDYGRRHQLSLTPFRRVMRDYALICGSYADAVRDSTPAQIEAVDMGRRGLHDEGSRLILERLAGKIELDHETARRLFTLIYTLGRWG